MKHAAVFLGVVALAMVLAGCGGGGGSTAATPATSQTVSAVGNWHLMANTSDYSDILLMTGALNGGTNGSVQGNLMVEGTRCTFYGPVSVTGTYSGNAMHLNASVLGTSVSIDGMLNQTGIKGTYKTAGPCGDVEGALIGIWVPTITGTWSGKLMSSYGWPDESITVQLTQSAAAGSDGWYPVTGTGTFSDGTYSFQGKLSGRELWMYFEDQSSPWLTIMVHMNDTATQAGLGAQPLTGWVTDLGTSIYITAMDDGWVRLDKK